jgi:hypothetical protein
MVCAAQQPKGDRGSISDKLQATDAANEFRCSAHKLLMLRSCGIRCPVEWSRTLRTTGQIGGMRLALNHSLPVSR